MPASAPSLFIATPCLDGNVGAYYTASLVRTMTTLQQKGWRSPQIDFEIGNSLIADARNKLVARFLASAATDLLFIDSDLSWSPDDLVRLGRRTTSPSSPASTSARAAPRSISR